MQIKIDAVILAGGMARRMDGNDKGLIELQNKPMIQYAIERIAPQVSNVFINANRNQSKYAEFGFKVISDENSGYLGPLAGMASAMAITQADLLMVIPCDCPMLPTDLVQRMLADMNNTNTDLVIASDGKRMQPVVMLLKPQLRASIRSFLESGDRKIALWYQQHSHAITEFTDQPNAFINVNTPEQKQLLAEVIAKNI